MLPNMRLWIVAVCAALPAGSIKITAELAESLKMMTDAGAQLHQPPSGMYLSTSMNESMSDKQLKEMMREQKFMDPNAELPREVNGSIAVYCENLWFTKALVIRVHVDTTCLYVDKSLKNFWGRNVTYAELQAALPDHSFYLTRIETKHLSDPKILTGAVDATDEDRTLERVAGEKLARQIRQELGAMSNKMPSLQRFDVIKQAIMKKGARWELNGDPLADISGPGLERLIAYDSITECKSVPGLQDSRSALFKSVLGGLEVLRTSTPQTYVYVH